MLQTSQTKRQSNVTEVFKEELSKINHFGACFIYTFVFQNLLSYPTEVGGLHRLVYSSHSSYSELMDMIETLNPKKIVPCVVPKNFTHEQVRKYIHNLVLNIFQ